MKEYSSSKIIYVDELMIYIQTMTISDDFKFLFFGSLNNSKIFIAKMTPPFVISNTLKNYLNYITILLNYYLILENRVISASDVLFLKFFNFENQSLLFCLSSDKKLRIFLFKTDNTDHFHGKFIFLYY